MIIPATCLPTLAESIDAKNVELCDFISHIGIISPVLLQIKVSIENYDETLLVNITSKTPCHFTGLSIQDDQMITKLLDNGLRLAILSVPADFSSGMNVISTFPRNRVGLECSYNEAAATIAKYREYIGHFVIK